MEQMARIYINSTQDVILSNKEQLLQKIASRTAVVGVVGLGYVGLPLAVEKAKVGYRVIGVEQNPRRAAKINRGENYIGDVSTEDLQVRVAKGMLKAVEDFSLVPQMDVIVICVPTPLTKNLTPDLQYVEKVTAEIGSRLRPGQLICLESTTYPGTTEEVMLPLLGNSGLTVEEDFFLAHSPERVDPETNATPPRIPQRSWAAWGPTPCGGGGLLHKPSGMWCRFQA